MTNINFTMGNVSQVAVSPINADATIRQGNATNQLTFAGVVVAPKGAPYEVIQITKENWQEKLGTPYHSSLGIHTDSLRAVGEAVEGGNGVVVRVVPTSATYPALKFSKPSDSVVIAHEALSYSADLELAAGEFFAIAIKDGAVSDNRKLTMSAADPTLYGENMFVLTLVEELAAGGDETLEEFIVSLEPTATDSMGSPAYIETVLDSKSSYLKVILDPTLAQQELTEIPETAFTGASNGDLSDIASTDYDAAIEALRNTVVGFNYVCGLACYDAAVIGKLISMMNDKRISGAFDMNPRLTHAEALAEKQSLNLNEHRATFTHLPYTSNCPYYGNKVLWGMSGLVFKAKAAGVAKTSPVGGWHYTPAGVDRAVISRAGIAPLKNLDTPDHEAMYKARLNKLATSENGNLFLDDSLTSCAQENYLRFEQVVSVTDAISRDFYALANRLKHQPDGITFKGLEDGMKAILEGYESVGALVTPRNPEVDGEDAYVFKIQQVEIDYWKVTWSICVTGSGRRFLGEPILVR